MKKLIGVFSLFVIMQLVAGFKCNAIEVCPFSNGLAVVMHYSEGTRSVINYNGVTIVPPGEYDRIWMYHNGMAICEKNGKYGYLNIHGELVIPTIYDHVYLFGGDYALVRKGKWDDKDVRYFTIDKKRGNVVYEFPDSLNFGYPYNVKPLVTNTGFFVFAYKGEHEPFDDKCEWVLFNHKGEAVSEIYDNPYKGGCDESSGCPDYVSVGTDRSAVIVETPSKCDENGNLIERRKCGAIDNNGVIILPLSADYDDIRAGVETLWAWRYKNDGDGYGGYFNPKYWDCFDLNGKKIEIPDNYILPVKSNPTTGPIRVYSKDTKRMGFIDRKFFQPLTAFNYFDISEPDKYGICVGKKGTCQNEEWWWNSGCYNAEEVDLISLNDSPEIIRRMPARNYIDYNDGVLLLYLSDEDKYLLWDVVTDEKLYKLNSRPYYFDSRVSVDGDGETVRNRRGRVVYPTNKY